MVPEITIDTIIDTIFLYTCNMEKVVEIINQHVETPFIAKDGVKWYIKFYYKDAEKKRKPFKKVFDLNKSAYLKKVKGVDVEINKVDRKLQAQGYIDGLVERLKTHYFNPETGTFETLDKSSLPLMNYFDDYIDDNSKYAKGEGTKTTYRAYNNTLRSFLESDENKYKSDIAIKDADQHFMQDFLSYIEVKDSIAHRDNLLMYTKAVFNHVKKHLEIIETNPAEKFKAINKFESESNKAMNMVEIKALLIAAKDLDIHFNILLRLVFYTLKRPDAILNLRFENFDFEGCHIKFPDKINKTNKKEYSTIPENLMQEIKSMIPENVKPDAFFMGNIGKFTGERNRGKPEYSKRMFAEFKTPYHHFGTKFETVFNRLKLAKGYTLYGMKHSGIVYLIEEHQWSNRQIMDYTGHKNERMIERYARSARRVVTPHPADI
jgi:integrase